MIHEIKKEMISAMKSKDKNRLNILRLINGKITEYIKDNPNYVEDSLINVLDSMVKERKKTIEIYTKANEIDRADDENYEISVISEFLPKRMSLDEIHLVIQNIITNTNAKSMKDMGKVMGIAKKEFGTNADPSEVAKTIKKILSD